MKKMMIPMGTHRNVAKRYPDDNLVAVYLKPSGWHAENGSACNCSVAAAWFYVYFHYIEIRVSPEQHSLCATRKYGTVGKFFLYLCIYKVCLNF
jgi:hypothetical protein